MIISLLTNGSKLLKLVDGLKFSPPVEVFGILNLEGEKCLDCCPPFPSSIRDQSDFSKVGLPLASWYDVKGYFCILLLINLSMFCYT